MPQEWTAEVVAQLHLHKLTIKQLAEEAGYTPEYLSMVLNGHRDPEKGEGQYPGRAGPFDREPPALMYHLT